MITINKNLNRTLKILFIKTYYSEKITYTMQESVDNTCYLTKDTYIEIKSQRKNGQKALNRNLYNSIKCPMDT